MPTRLVRLSKTIYHPAECVDELIYIPPQPPTTICADQPQGGLEPIFQCFGDEDNPLVVGDEGGGQTCVIVGYRPATGTTTVCQTHGGHSGYYLLQTICREAYEEVVPAHDWEGHADSVDAAILSGAGAYTWEVSPSPVGIIFGIAPTSKTVRHYRDLPHALLFNSQNDPGAGSYVRVLRYGELVGGAVAFSGGEVWKLERDANKIRYYYDTTLLAEVDLEVGQADVQAWGFLYQTGDQIINKTLADLDAVGDVPNGAGQPGRGWAIEDGVDDEFILGLSMPASGTIANGYSSTTTIDGGGMPGRGWGYYDLIYRAIYGGAMPPQGTLRQENEFVIDPVYAYGAGMSGTGWIIGLAGGIGDTDNGGMPGRGLAIEDGVSDYSIISGDSMPARGLAVDYTPINELNILDINYPLLGFDAFATVQEPDTLALTVSYGFEANEGGRLTADVAYGFEAAGAKTNLGILTADVLFGMTGAATYGDTGVIEIDYDLLTFTAIGGGILTADVGFAFSATGVHQAPGTLTADVGFAFSATAVSQIATGVLDVEYELISMANGAVLTADVLFGFAAIAGTYDAPVETYVMNTSNGAITRYSLGFVKFFRLGDKHYGLDANGVVYEFTGSDDLGANINAVALTYASEFDIPRKKNIPRVYVDARADNGLMLSTLVDEVDLYRYRTSRLASSNIKDKPVKLKRGIKGQRWAFEIRNLSGDNATIYSFDPLIRERERRTLS